jgi:site-specific DNA-methyltransferase (cytosine-N4-specific)
MQSGLLEGRRMTKNQLSLKLDLPDNFDKYILSEFSADSVSNDSERINLENRYKSILKVISTQNRRSVSFQLNKNRGVFGWFKYREGFSPDLVETYLRDMTLNHGDLVMDPFMGSGTTALVAAKLGFDSIGFDILPTSEIAIKAKGNLMSYDVQEIRDMMKWVSALKVPSSYTGRVNSVKITYSAYPDKTDRELAYLQSLMNPNSTAFSDQAINLLMLAILNSLEDLSYTRKDGQYLRWDERSKKVQETDAQRTRKGKEPIKNRLNKGELPMAFPKISDELSIILEDIESAQMLPDEGINSNTHFVNNTVLEELPKVESESVSAVITSPPYLNRYDYTRTYALELAFLGFTEEKFRQVRQKLLSSTVENKSKRDRLRDYYERNGNLDRFEYIVDKLDNDSVLQEINEAMIIRANMGDLNNKGVVQMIHGYFEELGFVIAELYRSLKTGAKVVIVNDNVRYGGEVIPVDFISMHLAERFGFTPDVVQTIEQQKGNSSQQMKKFGRVPLRKSITVWHK